mmetsp:Transcript_47447/g.146382  ORF Transcript_47447/g.146382 Transcript_47447/m.146382 type:complete len:223 (+) Transcript_47447:560-1228(+)
MKRSNQLIVRDATRHTTTPSRLVLTQPTARLFSSASLCSRRVPVGKTPISQWCPMPSLLRAPAECSAPGACTARSTLPTMLRSDTASPSNSFCFWSSSALAPSLLPPQLSDEASVSTTPMSDGPPLVALRTRRMSSAFASTLGMEAALRRVPVRPRGKPPKQCTRHCCMPDRSVTNGGRFAQVRLSDHTRRLRVGARSDRLPPRHVNPRRECFSFSRDVPNL